MPMTNYAYLRVSTDDQNINSQKLGIYEYANQHGFTNIEDVYEVTGRNEALQNRELGKLLDRVGQGDTILIAEFTRIGGRPSQVFSFLEAASLKGVAVHITKSKVVMDGSIASQIMASVFSMASMIELSFIRERTKEGLRRVKAEGKTLGRPVGSTGRLKLDNDSKNVAEVIHQLGLGVSKRQIAKNLGVSYNTLNRFIERYKL